MWETQHMHTDDVLLLGVHWHVHDHAGGEAAVKPAPQTPRAHLHRTVTVGGGGLSGHTNSGTAQPKGTVAGALSAFNAAWTSRSSAPPPFASLND